MAATSSECSERFSGRVLRMSAQRSMYFILETIAKNVDCSAISTPSAEFASLNGTLE